MKNIQVHYEIFILYLSKMFKTMNIHFKFEANNLQKDGIKSGPPSARPRNAI